MKYKLNIKEAIVLAQALILSPKIITIEELMYHKEAVLSLYKRLLSVVGKRTFNFKESDIAVLSIMFREVENRGLDLSILIPLQIEVDKYIEQNYKQYL